MGGLDKKGERSAIYNDCEYFADGRLVGKVARPSH